MNTSSNSGQSAVQYAPYQGGLGEVYWLKNKKGINIPVVTAKYAMWKDQKMMEDYTGNPQTLPENINRDLEINKTESKKSFFWTSVHAWSEFKNPNNQEEKAAGVSPIKWATEKLSEDIIVVSIEELLWRLRMEHYPEETLAVIHDGL
jgi:hypothetical protein